MRIEELRSIIRCSLGIIPADLVIKNVTIVNVFTEEFIEGSIALKNGYIARVGDVNDVIRDSTTIINGNGLYAAPAFIDAHIHIESSMLTLTEFAKATIPHGTGTIITDIHELTNVIGEKALKLILNEAKNLPLNVFIMVPSCVPAAPGIDTSGARIDSNKVKELINLPNVLGLGEMMNYPGVLNTDTEVLEKIITTHRQRKIVDGHAPLLFGKELQAYIAAGILTDHESTTGEEAISKLRNGMYLMAREGSLSKNLNILASVMEKNLSLERCIIVSDDKHPNDLLINGHLEPALRKAINMGIDPIKAIKMVTINPARAYRLDRIGAIGPGYYADIALIRDLEEFKIEKVFLKGQLVAENGKLLVDLPRYDYPEEVLQTIHVKKIPNEKDLTIEYHGEDEIVSVNVIGVREESLITDHIREKMKVRNNMLLPDPAQDILEIVVVERHKNTGNIGKGFVKGFGLERGALASSVAHDSHNIICVGASLKDMCIAIGRLIEIRGGLVVVESGKILAELSLPLGGLISLESVESVATKLSEINSKTQKLGCKLKHPFLTLSFLALPVIPKLKMTDKGLFDVEEFKHIDVIS